LCIGFSPPSESINLFDKTKLSKDSNGMVVVKEIATKPHLHSIPTEGNSRELTDGKDEDI
jgi:hypothetical protein